MRSARHCLSERPSATVDMGDIFDKAPWKLRTGAIWGSNGIWSETLIGIASKTHNQKSPMASARGFVLKEHRRYALLLHKSAQAVVNLANPTDKVPCRWLPRPCVALAMSSEMIAIQDGIVRVESDW